LKSRSAAVHYSVNVPDALKSLSSIEKDVRRFPKTHGWAYAKFDYGSATDTFAPDAEGAECVPYDGGAQDYIFTAFEKGERGVLDECADMRSIDD